MKNLLIRNTSETFLAFCNLFYGQNVPFSWKHTKDPDYLEIITKREVDKDSMNRIMRSELKSKEDVVISKELQ